jgi:hypothetical protein
MTKRLGGGLMALFIASLLSCATTQQATHTERLHFPITIITGTVSIKATGYVDAKGIFYEGAMKNGGILPNDYGEFDNDEIERKTVDLALTKKAGESFQYKPETNEVVFVTIRADGTEPAEILCSGKYYKIDAQNAYGLNLVFVN